MAKMDLSLKIKYLIGVPSQYLNSCDSDLASHPEWTVMRHLCSLRSKLIPEFTELNTEFREQQKPIGDINAIKELVETVRKDNIRLSDHPGSLSRVIMEVNNEIEYRIVDIFPDDDIAEDEEPSGVPMEWVRRLFIMQDNTIDGVRESLRKYKKYRNYYPWQMYMNVNFSLLEEDVRSKIIIANDRHLEYVLELLNKKRFWSIFDFVGVNCPVIVVDCENSDPQRLYSSLKPVLPWVNKIVLIDGTKTNMLWNEFVLFTQGTTKIAHIKTPRLKEQKSLVDYTMVAKTCEEYYVNNVRSFMLASSDSDIWALICSIPEANVFVAAERCKSGDFLEEALTQNHIPFAYMDDLVQDSTELMDSAMDREVPRFLAKGCDKKRAVLNAVSKLHIYPPESEMERLFNRDYPVETMET